MVGSIKPMDNEICDHQGLQSLSEARRGHTQHLQASESFLYPTCSGWVWEVLSGSSDAGLELEVG